MLPKEIQENNIYFYIDKNKIKNNFNNYSRFGNVYYPLKANSNINVLNTLIPLINNTDNKFLISYIDHFNILKKLNVDPKYMCLMNVLSTNETVKYLYNEGVRAFTFDNIDSIKKFTEYADLKNVDIVIRLSTIDIFDHVFTHLGANTNECQDIINLLNGKCNNIGLSFYLNSEIKKDVESLPKMLNYIVNNFNKYNIKFINIGGIESYDKIDFNLLNDVKLKLNIHQINLEPGQYLLEDTIDMETEIIRAKIINDKKIIIIKNGIFSGFLDKLLYDKNFEFYFKSRFDGNIKIKYNKTNHNDSEFIIFGGSSDSADKLGIMFIDKIYYNELIEGSKFYIKHAGTYFEEFFMAYSNDLNIKYIDS